MEKVDFVKGCKGFETLIPSSYRAESNNYTRLYAESRIMALATVRPKGAKHFY